MGTRTLGLALAVAGAAHAAQDPRNDSPQVDAEVARIEQLAKGTAADDGPQSPADEFREAVRIMVENGQTSQIDQLGSSAVGPLEWTLEQQKAADMVPVSGWCNALRHLIRRDPMRAISALDRMLTRDPARFDVFWVHAAASSRLAEAMANRSDLREPFRALAERVIASNGLPTVRKVEIAARALAYTDGNTAVDRYLFDDRSRWASIRGSSMGDKVAGAYVRRRGELLEDAPGASAAFALGSSVEAAQDALGHKSPAIREQVAIQLASESFGPEVDGRALGWLLTLAQDPNRGVSHLAIHAVRERAQLGKVLPTFNQWRALLDHAIELEGPGGDHYEPLITELIGALARTNDVVEIEGGLRQLIAQIPGSVTQAIGHAILGWDEMPLPAFIAAKRVSVDHPAMDGRKLLQNVIQQLRRVPGRTGADQAIEVVVRAGLTVEEGESVFATIGTAARDASPEARAQLLRWMAATNFDQDHLLAAAAGSGGTVSPPIRALCMDPKASAGARALAGFAILSDSKASPDDVKLAADAIIALISLDGSNEFREQLFTEVRRKLPRSGRRDEAVIDIFDRYPGPVGDLSLLYCSEPSSRLRPAARAQAVAVARRCLDTPKAPGFLDRCGVHVLAGLIETKAEESNDIALALMEHHSEGSVLEAAEQGHFDALRLARAHFATSPSRNASYRFLLKLNDSALLPELADGALRSGNAELIQHIKNHIDAIVELRTSLARLKELEEK